MRSRFLLQVTCSCAALCLLSCRDAKPDPPPEYIQSFELDHSNGKDTINVLDHAGRKQGVWIVGKDTTVYRNDTAYSTKGTTAHEVIERLNRKK